MKQETGKMMKKGMWIPLGLAMALAGCATPGNVSHQDAKTRIHIQYATVESAEPATFESNAGKAAAFGGLGGLVLGSSGDRHDMARGALAGAALLGLATKIAEGPSQGMGYTLINVGGSAPYKIVTDDIHAQPGDCVAVETGHTTNLRRVSQSLCQPKLEHPVEVELDRTIEREALECDTAKQQLLDAKGDTDINAAIKKVKVLCQ